jgi:hypothetical protein
MSNLARSLMSAVGEENYREADDESGKEGRQPLQ